MLSKSEDLVWKCVSRQCSRFFKSEEEIYGSFLVAAHAEEALITKESQTVKISSQPITLCCNKTSKTFPSSMENTDTGQQNSVHSRRIRYPFVVSSSAEKTPIPLRVNLEQEGLIDGKIQGILQKDVVSFA